MCVAHRTEHSLVWHDHPTRLEPALLAQAVVLKCSLLFRSILLMCDKQSTKPHSYPLLTHQVPWGRAHLCPAFSPWQGWTVWFKLHVRQTTCPPSLPSVPALSPSHCYPNSHFSVALHSQSPFPHLHTYSLHTSHPHIPNCEAFHQSLTAFSLGSPETTLPSPLPSPTWPLGCCIVHGVWLAFFWGPGNPL